jgi:hypothetical protein
VARVLYGKKRLKPPGFLNMLAQDAQTARRKYGLSGARQACERLPTLREYRKKYGHYKPNTLLKFLNHATDPEKNPDFEELVKGLPQRKKYDRFRLYKKGRVRKNKKVARKSKGVRSHKTASDFPPRLEWWKGRLYKVQPRFVRWKDRIYVTYGGRVAYIGYPSD